MTRDPKNRSTGRGGLPAFSLPQALRTRQARLTILLCLLLGFLLFFLNARYLILYALFLFLIGGMIAVNALTHRDTLATALEAKTDAARAVQLQPKSTIRQERYVQAARYYYALLRTTPGNRPTPSIDDERRIQMELHELIEEASRERSWL